MNQFVFSARNQSDCPTEENGSSKVRNTATNLFSESLYTPFTYNKLIKKGLKSKEI